MKNQLLKLIFHWAFCDEAPQNAEFADASVILAPRTSRIALRSGGNNVSQLSYTYHFL